jgi:hypothetical protein
MTRFTGVVLALALVCGCAGSKKDEAVSAGSPGPTSTEKGNSATQDTNGTGSTTATPTLDQAHESRSKSSGGSAPGGGSAPDTQQGQGPTDTKVNTIGATKPLDPSANADPNTDKSQARANGLLGATSNFDDSPVDLQYDAPDDAIKTLLAQQKAGLAACHKTGGGTLELELTVDANGKVTKVKFLASSTVKDAKARNCVVAELKKLKLDKGTKPTGSIKLVFPK